MQKLPIKAFPLSHSRGQRRSQQLHGPASIWQLADVMAIVQCTREATRSSAFACELGAADSPRPLAFISNLSFLSAGLVRGWPSLELKGDFLQCSGPLNRSCACGRKNRVLRGLAHRGQFATKFLPLFPVSFWSTVLDASNKTLRDGVSYLQGSGHEREDESYEILGYSSSPWITDLAEAFGEKLGGFMSNIIPLGLSTVRWYVVCRRVFPYVHRSAGGSHCTWWHVQAGHLLLVATPERCGSEIVRYRRANTDVVIRPLERLF